MEYFYQFSQSVSIPDDVDAAKISSAYKDGILTVTLPKIQGKKQPKGTNIPIN